jgi:hypothetical protein
MACFESLGCGISRPTSGAKNQLDRQLNFERCSRSDCNVPRSEPQRPHFSMDWSGSASKANVTVRLPQPSQTNLKSFQHCSKCFNIGKWGNRLIRTRRQAACWVVQHLAKLNLKINVTQSNAIWLTAATGALHDGCKGGDVKTESPNIVILTDAFGGGISEFNKDVIRATDDCPIVSRFMYPLR